MARFIVRIELPHAESSDYQRLYERLDAYGFANEIKSDNNIWYSLPVAEYYYIGNSDLESVSRAAFDVAKSINAQAKVLVTEVTAHKWLNLDTV